MKKILLHGLLFFAFILSTAWYNTDYEFKYFLNEDLDYYLVDQLISIEELILFDKALVDMVKVFEDME